MQEAAEIPRPEAAIPAAEAALWSDLKGPRGQAARLKLFEKFQPLAKRIAWRFLRDEPATPVELAELQQLASVGLLEAINQFQPERGVPFRYYCPRRIGGAIADGIARLSEVNQQIVTTRRVRRERARSLAQVETTPAGLDTKLTLIGDIAAELAIGLMLEGSGLYVEDDRDPAADAYDTLAWKQAVGQVGKVLNSLPDRDRQVITLHYIEGLPFDQIARLLELSKGRISQIHKAALALLRRRLTAGGRFMLEG